MIKEIITKTSSGWQALFFILIGFLISAGVFILGIASTGVGSAAGPIIIVLGVLLIIADLVLFGGFFTVQPNQGVVLIFFGKYIGTEKSVGFKWTNPLYSKHKISLRIRNFECERLKVNDKNGNPVDISAVVVWRVEDTAEAVFEVDDYLEFVRVQTESAVRHLATIYPYDTTDEEEIGLRSSIEEVSERLTKEIQERVDKAGVDILEARINHLAYAQEIAQAMLQRQQAEAIIAARAKIVEGAVSMVDMALEHIERDNIVQLDEERKASMISNLMVVLCSDHHTQPIINTGSLY